MYDELCIAGLILVILILIYYARQYLKGSFIIQPSVALSPDQVAAVNNLYKQIDILFVMYRKYPGYDTQKIGNLSLILERIQNMPQTYTNYVQFYNALRYYSPTAYADGTLPVDSDIIRQLYLIQRAISDLGVTLNLE